MIAIVAAANWGAFVLITRLRQLDRIYGRDTYSSQGNRVKDRRPHAAGERSEPINGCAREAAPGATGAKGRRHRAIFACCPPRVP
jgi:hypothetical protein